MTTNSCIATYRCNSTLVRPCFHAGLLLRDDDLTAGVDYTRNLSRLLFRSLFGCGVVCGLTVGWKDSCGKLVITVSDGVALTGSGDPIHVPQPVSLTLDPCGEKKLGSRLWVTLCATEKSCSPRPSMCDCDDDAGNVNTRTVSGYEICVGAARDDCACGCEEQKIVKPQTEANTSTSQQKKPNMAKLADAASGAAAGPPANGCACADPCATCHQDHYAGNCGCDCGGGCVVLAVLDRMPDDPKAPKGAVGDWQPNHSVRRFIRPVLMRDPEIVRENGRELCPDHASTRA